MTNMTTKSKPQDKSKMCEIDDHILKLFEIKKRLGKGAYGIVWKAIDKRNEDVVAVKKIFDAFRDETDAQRTFREIIFLNAFRSHPNIVKLHNVFRAANNLDIYLVFEYMESDLHNIIKRGSVLKNVHKRYVMYQLINAIKYIHSGNVIHRDLKPSNILIDSRCRCKLADFGLARSVSNHDSNIDVLPVQLLTDYVATRWYRAPEILVASKRYTKGIDMWSLGCILGEMLRGKPLFQGNSTINQIERIVCALPEITNNDIEAVGADFGSVLLNKQISRERKTCLEDILGDIPDDAMNLVKSLLVLDPLARLTAHQALEHPYITRFRHSIVETDLQMNIVPPFSDDVRLTVPQYRAKLYEIVNDVPILKPYRSACSKRTNQSQKTVSNFEKRSHSKTKITSTGHLERKESRDRIHSAIKSQEHMSIKNNSPQIKNVPIKTMISTLPSTKSVNLKPEVMPNNDANNDVNNDGKVQRKASRKIHKIRTVEAVNSTTTMSSVDKCTENKTVKTKVPMATQSSQESITSLQATSAAPTVDNVRSLIKKRVSSNSKLLNFSHSQTLLPKPQQQQQQIIKPQIVIQQQLNQQQIYKQQQQQEIYRQQQQEIYRQQEINKQQIIKEQKIQQHQIEQQEKIRQLNLSQQHQYHNKQTHNPPKQTQLSQQQSQQHIPIHYHKHSNNNNNTNSPLRVVNEFHGNHLQRKSIEQYSNTEQQCMQQMEHNRNTHPSDPPLTTDSMKNIRQRINNALAHSEVCKLKSQNVRINRETVNSNEIYAACGNNNNNNNHNKDFIRPRDKRTKSAEYTINRQGFPTISKDNGEDVHCYEERLRRIEVEINCYKDAVKSYAYDNLHSSTHKLELATKSCDRILEEPAKLRTTPLYKPNPNVQQLNNINNNNAQQLLNNNNKVANKHFSYSPTSSSSHCSSESDLPQHRTKRSFTNFPTVYTKNSFCQLVQRNKNKSVNNSVGVGIGEMSTGGSGDHLGERNINRPLEISFREYQQQDHVQNNQQRLQFKRSVTNLIKADLKPTNTKVTIQPPVSILSPPTTTTTLANAKSMMYANTNEYRYKSSSRRKTTTKAY